MGCPLRTPDTAPVPTVWVNCDWTPLTSTSCGFAVTDTVCTITFGVAIGLPSAAFCRVPLITRTYLPVGASQTKPTAVLPTRVASVAPGAPPTGAVADQVKPTSCTGVPPGMLAVTDARLAVRL